MEGEWRFVSAGLEWLVAWLDANNEWVFSGIGVAALGALWALFRWFVARRRGDKAQLQSSRGSVVVGDNMTGSTVVTGDHNVVTVTRTKGIDSEDCLAVAAEQLGVNKKAATLEQRNRQRMLEKVQHFWIDGVLDQSLYQVARIELGLSEEPEAIQHPWKLVAQHPELAPRTLPDGTPMREIFDQFDQTLLILGAPGSGKTTLLLELARDLIERAKEDASHPIPVVFNLSSWAVRQPALTEWLVDELNQRYDVPRTVAQAWVDRDQVLPLLDGLDEVAPEHRDASVEAINVFRAEHGLLPLVVCSRSKDYEALTVQLRLLGAVTIQPLSREQIEQYLERAGTALSGVHAAVRDDETLWELLDTPLMLSILALAYQGRMAARAKIARLKGSLEERRAALFDAYLGEMFTRRENTAAPYTPGQTRHWLSWLAQAMVRHDQSVFYLERMQPDWLWEKRKRLQRIGARLVGKVKPVETLRWSWDEARKGLLFGFASGPFLALPVGMAFGLGFGLFAGVSFGLASGLVFGLASGLVEDEISKRTTPNEGIRRSLRNALLLGQLFGLVGGLLFGLFAGVGFGLDFGLFAGAIFGLLSFLNSGLVKGGGACIQHGLLRLFLWRYDYAPLNYVRFLEHAKDLLFLRRVGGGYIFAHRMLMEHFAGLEKPADTETSS